MNDALRPCLAPNHNQSLAPNHNQILEESPPNHPSLPESVKEMESEVGLLQEMIALLQDYEKQCIEKLDLKGAKETRGRIEQLSGKQQQMRERIISTTHDRRALEMSQEQEDLIQCFERVWSQHLNETVAALAECEQQLRSEQRERRKELNERFDCQKTNGFKPSTKLSNLKRKVVGLMKMHHYQEAEFQSERAKKLQAEQVKNWHDRTEQRRRNALELFSKKANRDFQVLRSKNEDLLYRKMSERDAKFAILLKKHQVKRVQALRSNKELMKSMSTTSLNTKRLQS